MNTLTFTYTMAIEWNEYINLDVYYDNEVE